MKQLIEVTRDAEVGSMYLRYSHAKFDRMERVGKKELVNADYAADESIIGIEIVLPDDDSIALAIDFARAHELSLLGVFVPAAVARAS